MAPDTLGVPGKERKMADWKCQKCGYTLQKEVPPEVCPQCKEKCEFVDVSCYIPDCGQTGQDPRIK